MVACLWPPSKRLAEAGRGVAQAFVFLAASWKELLCRTEACPVSLCMLRRAESQVRSLSARADSSMAVALGLLLTVIPFLMLDVSHVPSSFDSLPESLSLMLVRS